MGGRSLAPLGQAGSICQDKATRYPLPRLHCSSLSDLIHIPLLHVASLPERTPAATQAHFHDLIFVTVHPQVTRHDLNCLIGENKHVCMEASLSQEQKGCKSWV